MKGTLTTSRTRLVLRRWDRTFRWSFVASVLLHILLIMLFRQSHPVPEIDYAAAGEDAGDTRAAAGGGMEVVALQIEQQQVAEPVVEPAVVAPEPVPVPVPDPPVVEPPRELLGSAASSSGTGSTTGEGEGAATGAGTETGTGEGGGGTSEEGTGVTAPSPRGLILPPSDRPRSVRGKTVTVYVFVDPRGAVVDDSTRLNPSTGDRGFDNRLKEQAAEWKFRPAMLAGRNVAAWFPYTITF